MNQWLVLRCASSRTMALAAALEKHGAWTPTWKRKRRLPRSPVQRVVTEACIPSFVFVPEALADDLPKVPFTPYSFMRFEGALIRITDRELDPLRRIADRPKVPEKQLPKSGMTVKFTEGPFQGLTARVLSCTQAYCSVAVDGLAHSMQVPPALLVRT